MFINKDTQVFNLWLLLYITSCYCDIFVCVRRGSPSRGGGGGKGAQKNPPRHFCRGLADSTNGQSQRCLFHPQDPIHGASPLGVRVGRCATFRGGGSAHRGWR